MAEQLAFDGGVMDLFPSNTGSAGPPPSAPSGQSCSPTAR